ncbi:serine/threonine-protein phosphatase 2A activator 2 [Cryptococcus amylolentus CBS 6273]|uniref:Serine/threonine-protein phosphatase 2A activator n=1 Tax=Cryptococcus amylolentus CBS 6273 TaxID=1296118 RepID=A0A1E3JAY8_9TREE|nr:serine/threonine-protein phosphatase 2A activator 2 [Cryptococcus amylolentus CBS 6273]
MSNGASLPSHEYQVPVKRILSKAHLAAFQRSQAHKDILSFIEDLNTSVVGKKLSEAGEGSERTKPVLAVLDQVSELAHATPPVDNKLSRFGNPAFKTFYDKVSSSIVSLHEAIPRLPKEAIKEVEVYFQESWGNKERVDYGSGMELNFLCWLLCLTKLGVFTKDDYSFLVLGVFWRYINVMRYLQSTYWLEPAGSHGVWGLDDYHFLPFLWGAAQLKDHKYLRPKAIHDPEILAEFSKDYIYLSCIQFINSIKTASLRWHSPMLDDISAVKAWAKVNEGMVKMFVAEVLGKLPVMQHALFGSLLRFPSVEEDEQLRKDLEAEGWVDGESGREDEHGHVHDAGEKGWTMDCCGIPVPSAFAAAHDAKDKGLPALTNRPGIKPIPFD